MVPKDSTENQATVDVNVSRTSNFVPKKTPERIPVGGQSLRSSGSQTSKRESYDNYAITPTVATIPIFAVASVPRICSEPLI